MSNSSFAPFSMMGDKGPVLDEGIDIALAIMKKIASAPEAAKENLMKTDFKVASVTLAFAGKILQAESGMAQAMAVIGERVSRSEEFKEFVKDNLPQIHTAKKIAHQKD